MSEFNLLDEGWISVVTDYKGTTKLVGMKEFFRDAHNYKAFAGDTKTQDFAVMRFLLAVLHTVFSRYDANGKPYEMLELNKRMQQVEEVYEEDESDYKDDLMKTWKDLWNSGKFPEIVDEYLEAWRDRFYLFDDKYPFYQVTRDIIKDIDPKYDNVESATTCIWPKLINRRISESENKIAIFSPKENSSKNILSNSELARWLITFQGVSNASDKKSIVTTNKSIGWIYKLGGVYLTSENLFKTMMLNLVLKHPEDHFITIQKPCWEFEIEDLYKKNKGNKITNNLAELYTDWSRLMYFFIKIPENIGVFRVIKTIGVKAEDNFLEPMTIWGTDNGKIIPKKHTPKEQAWKSFGLIISKAEENKNRLPGIILNLKSINRFIKDMPNIHIKCTSAVDDNKPASRAMVDEAYDFIDLNFNVAMDLKDKGWVERINIVVDETKYVIDVIYNKFLEDIKELTNIKSSKYIDNLIELAYFNLNLPFKEWISSISYNDDKEVKTKEWLDNLKKIIFKQAEELAENASNKEYRGKTSNRSVKNIASAFNSFAAKLNKKVK